MTDIRLAVEVAFVSRPHGTDEQFEGFLDAVVDQLAKIDCEVQLAASLVDRRADFATSIEAGDFTDAANSLLVDLRTALHAAGCNTSNWPTFEATGHVVRQLQDA